MRIVVTGATGFVGRPTCEALQSAGHAVVALARSADAHLPQGIDKIHVPDLADRVALGPALRGADAIVHLAARTHVLRETATNVDELYRNANVATTEALAAAAVAAGVKRFVYVSSIKVNGEGTAGPAFRADDGPHPEDAYGRSKAEAERRLTAVAGVRLPWTILRPPLLYGPGVRGNVLRLYKLLAAGVPLPFAGIENARDLLDVAAFADLIALTVDHPAAANKIFLAHDGTPFSTPGLCEAIATSLGRRARLFPVPRKLLYLAGMLTGRTAEIDRLAGDLRIDDRETRELLGWAPRRNPEAAFAETAAWYLSTRGT